MTSHPPSGSHPDRAALLDAAYDAIHTLERRLNRAVRGRAEVIDLLLIALLADGHVLLEDYPGSGKTTLAKSLGESILDGDPHDEIAPFRRIQFTPDLLPSDITGVTVFDPDTGGFQFRHGPLFAHIVLADEINRTSPKVQSAMLEAMAEKQVTVDNTSYPLDDLFFVVATQNPRDLPGTYPLPVAQHDRFLFKVCMDFIDRESEIEVLTSARERKASGADALPKVSRDQLVEARASLESFVHVDPRIHTCLVDMARALRESPQVAQGVSTRSLVLMLPALQACALKKARDFVRPEDVEYLAPYVFAHRLALAPGVEDAARVVRETIRGPLETLSRSSLR